MPLRHWGQHDDHNEHNRHKDDRADEGDELFPHSVDHGLAEQHVLGTLVGLSLGA